MRICKCSCLWLVILTSLVLCFTKSADAWPLGRIDAVRGKQYRLTSRHGPWMIMVASFHAPPPDLRTEGMSPRQAADELVYELRKKGIPAYTFSQQDVVDQIETIDRLGRKRTREYTAQQASISVLAGNYAAADNKVAQKTLFYIKKFHPQFLRRVEKSGRFLQKLTNGGIYRRTPGRPGPLSGAFLTLNPVLSPEEIRRQKRSPLLMKLNAGMEYSLLENKGKYTLAVASFYGKSLTQLESTRFDEAAKKFKVSSALDEAAVQAWELARSLREAKVEAYVFHDRHRSVVTVGSFDSPRDPRIRHLKKIYGAKIKKNRDNGQDVLVAETFTIPRNPKPNVRPLKSWIFDPYPKLIEVPQL